MSRKKERYIFSFFAAAVNGNDQRLIWLEEKTREDREGKIYQQARRSGWREKASLELADFFFFSFSRR